SGRIIRNARNVLRVIKSERLHCKLLVKTKRTRVGPRTAERAQTNLIYLQTKVRICSNSGTHGIPEIAELCASRRSFNEKRCDNNSNPGGRINLFERKMMISRSVA